MRRNRAGPRGSSPPKSICSMIAPHRPDAADANCGDGGGAPIATARPHRKAQTAAAALFAHFAPLLPEGGDAMAIRAYPRDRYFSDPIPRDHSITIPKRGKRRRARIRNWLHGRSVLHRERIGPRPFQRFANIGGNEQTGAFLQQLARDSARQMHFFILDIGASKVNADFGARSGG